MHKKVKPQEVIGTYNLLSCSISFPRELTWHDEWSKQLSSRFWEQQRIQILNVIKKYSYIYWSWALVYSNLYTLRQLLQLHLRTQPVWIRSIYQTYIQHILQLKIENCLWLITVFSNKWSSNLIPQRFPPISNWIMS